MRNWGDELTAEKMKKCVWLRPEAVVQVEFLERTRAVRLRHSKFVALRDDKNPRTVVKETYAIGLERHDQSRGIHLGARKQCKGAFCPFPSHQYGVAFDRQRLPS